MEVQTLFRQAEEHYQKKEYGRAARFFGEVAKSAPEGSKELTASQERLVGIAKRGDKRLSEVGKKENVGKEEKVVAEYQKIAEQFEGLPQAETARTRLAVLAQGAAGRDATMDSTAKP